MTDDELYLVKQGWQRLNTLSSWCWQDKRFPGVSYKLKDALTVARGLERERSQKRSKHATARG